MKYQKFIILAQPRTGSTMLVEALKQHPNVLIKGEAFNPSPKAFFNSGDSKNPYYMFFTLFPYLSLLIRNLLATKFLNKFIFRDYNQSIRQVGFKIFPEHFKGFKGKMLKRYFIKNDFQIIYLKRKNLLEQLVSLNIADQTGQWYTRNSKNTSSSSIVLNSVDVETKFNELGKKLNVFKHLFKDLKALEIDYESLCEKPDDTLKSVQEFLEIQTLQLSFKSIKQETRSMDSVIENYDDLREYFKGTPHEYLFTSSRPETQSP